jgi:hypothetical protein
MSDVKLNYQISNFTVLRACLDFLSRHTAKRECKIAEFKTLMPDRIIAKYGIMHTASNFLVNFVAPASPVRGGESRRCDIMKDVPLVQCSVQQQDRCRRQAANWTPKHVYNGNICRADDGTKQTGHTKLTDTARELDTAYGTLRV